MGSASEPEYRSLSIDEFLARLSLPQPAPAGGSVTALVAALAAGLCVKAALLAHDLADAESLAAHAASLRDAATELAQRDATAYAALVAARHARKAGEPADVEGTLAAASDVPVEIASLCAEVAALAADLARRGNANLRGDAAAAALMAAAAAASCAALVAINAADEPGDPRHERVADLANTAAASAADAWASI